MSAAPDCRVLEDVLEPVGNCLTPEVARRIANLRASAATQRRLDELADKSTNGSLTSDETTEYQTYVTAINFLGVLQAKARTVMHHIGES